VGLRGVVFDLFGTLVEGWGTEMAATKADEVAEILGVPAPTFRELMAATYTPRACGQLGGPREMLARLCAMLGVDPGESALAEAARHRVAQFADVLSEPRPGVSSLLATLRDREIQVGLLSDCSGETPQLWPRLSWTGPIQSAVLSWSEGARKPAPALYRRVADLIQLEPTQCLYVGDGGSQELSGAERSGMRAVRLQVPRRDGDRLLQYDPDASWSGPAVSNLFGILPLLGA